MESISDAVRHVPDSDIPIHVISFGGVGSKMIVRWLYPDREAGYKERSHHHWRAKPEIASGQRFIYVFGDPRNTAVSFFQRKQSRHAGHGFEWSEKHRLPYPQWTELAVKNLEARPVGLTREWEMADIVSRGVDAFQFEDHFQRWLAYADDLPVTFVRYETVWDHTSLMAKLFRGDAAGFPPRTERRADWQNEKPEVGEGLTRLYGDFAKYLAALPDIFTVEERQIVSVV